MSDLATSDRSNDQKRLRAGCDRFGQWGIRGLVGQIFLAGEESQERAPLLRVMIANCPTQHGIASLKRIEHRALCQRTFHFEGYLAAHVRQRSQMLGKYDSDHMTTILQRLFQGSAILQPQPANKAFTVANRGGSHISVVISPSVLMVAEFTQRGRLGVIHQVMHRLKRA